jgi:hypothetical protein
MVGFYRSQKCDQHFRLPMPEHSDWSAIISEAVSQIGGEGIRTLAELVIGQPPVSADMRDRLRSRQGPVIDLFDEIHSKTLINKWRRGKVATTVHRD